MLRKSLIIAAAGLAIVGTGSLTSRANALPLGLPADAIDQVNIVDPVALCFYVDGWNGPGLYECGYRFRRGFGWHGHRDGGGRAISVAAAADATCTAGAAVAVAGAAEAVAAAAAAARGTSDFSQAHFRAPDRQARPGRRHVAGPGFSV